jgi:hypothetical protein
MENQLWKRELFTTWQKDQQRTNKWAILRSVRSSATPPGDIRSLPTGETFKEYVVSEQTPGELQGHGKYLWRMRREKYCTKLCGARFRIST